MKKIKVYIFNSASRAAAYGIGSYIDQLKEILINTDIEFGIIYLNAEGDEISVKQKKEDEYLQINIPAVSYYNKYGRMYYSRNVAYMLKEFIHEEKDTKLVFQFNFMTDPYLAVYLKKMFRCKLLLVAHYTNWSFSLLGDKKRLLDILKTNARKRTLEEKTIVCNLRDDIRMIKKSDCFICVAQHTLKTFLMLSDIDRNKCIVVNNALKDSYSEVNDNEKITLRNKYKIGQDEQIVLFVGRLDEVKGISFLLQAFKKTLETHPKAHLFLLGDGNYVQWLKEANDDWSKITFTGWLNKDKLSDFYKIANVGVVCSIHEEFGLVAIEMMMHRIPVVVSDTSGLSEIIEDKVSGLKVPVRTVKGKRIILSKVLAEKISILLDNKNLAEQIAIEGRKRFLAKYEIKDFSNKMLETYNQI